MNTEQTILALCDAFSRTNVDELLLFFADEAVYEKIPVGRFNGKDEIRGTLDVFFGPDVTVRFEVLNISTNQSDNGAMVLMERLVHFDTGSHKISLPAMAIFELDEKNKITAWRDYFDRGQAGLS